MGLWRHECIVDELAVQVEADLKRAGRLRQSILKRAFAGRLVPQDPTDEPAEKLLERVRASRISTENSGREARSRNRSPTDRGKPATMPRKGTGK